jgi:hypothetical protein
MTGRSSNVWKPTGSIEFSQGNCPYCYGVGQITSEGTLNLNIAVLWNYRDWIGWNNIPDDNRTAFGNVQTLSLLSTLTDIKRAKEET